MLTCYPPGLVWQWAEEVGVRLYHANQSKQIPYFLTFGPL